MGCYATIVEREKELTCTMVVKGVRRWKSKVLARQNYFQTPPSHGMGDCVPFFPLTIDIVNYAFMPLFTGRISYNDQGIPVV